MRPIGDDLERKAIDDRLKDEDLDLAKRFFSFWYNRNAVDPLRPGTATTAKW